MSSNITNEKILNIAIDRFGPTDTLTHYVRQGKQAGARLNLALADKNALTAAKEARDLIAAIDTIDEVVKLMTTQEEQSKRPTKK